MLILFPASVTVLNPGALPVEYVPLTLPAANGTANVSSSRGRTFNHGGRSSGNCADTPKQNRNDRRIGLINEVGL